MSFGAVLEKGIMKSTYTDRVVSRSLKEQMSLIISIYSNISASRLPQRLEEEPAMPLSSKAQPPTSSTGGRT